MRYYDIAIRDPKSGRLIQSQVFKTLGASNSTYTSFVNGKTLQSALDIEIQVFTIPFSQPLQGSFVRIWGISLDEISQSNDLNDCQITIKAGMQKGLPLAKPEQAGVIAAGTIYRSVGNWEELDKRLDLYLYFTDRRPLNFAFVWKKGTQLSQAIQNTLSTAIPNTPIIMKISDQLIANTDYKGQWDRIEAFSTGINNVTTLPLFANRIKPQGGGTYQGVTIVPKGNSVIVSDGTADTSANSQSNPKTIFFEDIIGQPTWVSPTSINFKCVMRGDLSVTDFVKLPKELAIPYVLTTQGAAIPGQAPSGNKLAIQGVFNIQRLMHFGRFRSPAASSWVTSIDAVFDSGAPSSGGTPTGGGLLGPI